MGNRRDEWLERAALLPELRTRVAQHPLALKAMGARIYDVDNVGYVDYLGAGGSVIVGYANQFILDAVRKTLSAGLPEGLHVPHEVELVEKLKPMLPWAGRWWLFRHSDEALRRLMAWVRRATGRPTVMVLDGSEVPGRPAMSGLEGERVVGLPPEWDVARITEALSEEGSEAAALVVDPLLSRAGVVPAPDGVLDAIAAECHRHGVLLVLDERVSGFRVDRGGAAARAGIEPDAAVYGGALGGGFPLGAVAFREGLEPESGSEDAASPPHPVSLAAAEAVLSILRNDSTYERLEERTVQLAEGMAGLADRFARPLVLNRVGSVFALYFSSMPVTRGGAARTADGGAYGRFAEALRAEGVLLPQAVGVPAFVSSAHGGKDIDETIDACERVLLRLHQEDMP